MTKAKKLLSIVLCTIMMFAVMVPAISVSGAAKGTVKIFYYNYGTDSLVEWVPTDATTLSYMTGDDGSKIDINLLKNAYDAIYSKKTLGLPDTATITAPKPGAKDSKVTFKCLKYSSTTKLCSLSNAMSTDTAVSTSAKFSANELQILFMPTAVTIPLTIVNGDEQSIGNMTADAKIALNDSKVSTLVDNIKCTYKIGSKQYNEPQYNKTTQKLVVKNAKGDEAAIPAEGGTFNALAENLKFVVTVESLARPIMLRFTPNPGGYRGTLESTEAFSGGEIDFSSITWKYTLANESIWETTFADLLDDAEKALDCPALQYKEVIAVKLADGAGNDMIADKNVVFTYDPDDYATKYACEDDTDSKYINLQLITDYQYYPVKFEYQDGSVGNWQKLYETKVKYDKADKTGFGTEIIPEDIFKIAEQNAPKGYYVTARDISAKEVLVPGCENVRKLSYNLIPVNVFFDYNNGKTADDELRSAKSSVSAYQDYELKADDKNEEVLGKNVIKYFNFTTKNIVTYNEDDTVLTDSKADERKPLRDCDYNGYTVYHVNGQYESFADVEKAVEEGKATYIEGFNDEGTNLAQANTTIVLRVNWVNDSDLIFKLYNGDGELSFAIGKGLKVYRWRNSSPCKRGETIKFSDPDANYLLMMLPGFEKVSTPDGGEKSVFTLTMVKGTKANLNMSTRFDYYKLIVEAVKGLLADK